MARAVTVIPAINTRFATSINPTLAKKRVAAYARVSTDFEEQQSSYEAQVDHYTKYIKANPHYEYVAVYSDEGISATSTKNRDGFNRMIADALGGKIDLILTKSVSRFTRNTVDTLTTVRQLKEKGVEVYFEKENIMTLDSKGELLITIMSSLAQEESRSISENVTWGQRKRFADGKVSLPYKQFLGYEKGEDGLPKIVEKEAKIVRLIYKMFLEGKAPSGIARHLTSTGIPTPSGKKNWQPSTIESILQNEKYKGSAKLQKKFTVNFLTKEQKINEGEVPQYYVENSHQPIVSPEVFDLVQHEFKKRTGKHMSSGSCFSSKIICGECGSFYGSKVWHSTSKYRRTIWQCNSKFKEKCNTPHIYEEQIKQAFVEVFNGFVKNKAEIIENCEDIIRKLTDNSTLTKETEKLQAEADEVLGLIRELVNENAHSAIDQEEYNKKNNALLERYEIIQSKLAKINDKILERKAKREQIAEFLKMLDMEEVLLTEFNEGLWNGVVDKVTVGIGLKFEFKDGTEVELGI